MNSLYTQEHRASYDRPVRAIMNLGTTTDVVNAMGSIGWRVKSTCRNRIKRALGMLPKSDLHKIIKIMEHRA